MKYLTDFRKMVETGMDPRPGSHRGYSLLLSVVYQRAQSYYCGMKAHIN